MPTSPEVTVQKTKRKKRRRKAAPTCTPVAKKRKKKKRKAAAKPAALARAKRRRKPVCRPKKKKKPVLRPQTVPAPAKPGDGGNPAPGPAPAVPAPPSGRSLGTIASPIGVYQGAFGHREAARLLWRAGFGPKPGDVERLAGMDLEAAVMSLTRPSGDATLDGPEPTVDGAPLSPLDTWSGPHLYWMDRMLRSSQPLVERLALVFHDWFATSNAGVGSNEFMLEQTNVFRANGLGSFSDMVRAVTTGRAMLVFLNGIDNSRYGVNENYGRELQELFTLGADRGAYSETDVRELARALTGWRADWTDGVGLHDFRFDATRWDPRNKTVFASTGPWNWEDACRLVVNHPLHASFFVAKLWSYFVPEPPSADVASKLEALYVSSGHQIRPVLEAILCSPELYEGPRMTKPPVVLVAGMLRALGRYIDGEQWAWLCDGAGQMLYEPPDVSGWDDKRWLDSNTIRARWDVVNYAVEGRTLSPDSDEAYAYPAETPEQAVASARAFWLDPLLSDDAVAGLTELARAFQPPDDTTSTPAWQLRQHASLRAQRQTLLRHLIAASP
ncbi:MAG: hypothetical protein QOE28_499, partial [Solirubrobacteraceae bacterium]|nr:hypothetical protein [Solirubrobacteraceae bacterium]